MKVRDANVADSELVAWTVLTALDRSEEEPDRMTECCRDPKSMYSWKNAQILEEDDGRPIGCIISYSGDDYESLREYTWGNLWKDVDEEFIRNTPKETHPGEYYLDSLAILPQYRGKGYGRILIEAAIERGRELGYDRIGLLVALHKPELRRYYEALGFRGGEEINFFGHRYVKENIYEGKSFTGN